MNITIVFVDWASTLPIFTKTYTHPADTGSVMPEEGEYIEYGGDQWFIKSLTLVTVRRGVLALGVVQHAGKAGGSERPQLRLA